MTDIEYMRRAIALAQKGAGWTAPNPMVGAVIVKDGRIIGEGYHEKCGELHAERNALASLTESAKGADMYVTLEPCCHYGRTPPCTEAIIEHGIRRVVIGSRDPNPKVSGKGAEILRQHGIIVEEDFLRDECDALNPVFFHYITTKKPYVVMKYAMSLDGKIATRTGASQWITGETARAHVHALRGRYAAILAGIGTVLADNPMLNCRLEGAHQPLRIVLDSHLQIPTDARLCQSAKEFPTLIAYVDGNDDKRLALEALGVETLALPADANGHVSLTALVEALGARGIDSLLIEGGGKVHEAALASGIVNHVYAYVAPLLLGGHEALSPVEGLGVSTPAEGAQLSLVGTTLLDGDILLEYTMKEGMNHVYWNR